MKLPENKRNNNIELYEYPEKKNYGGTPYTWNESIFTDCNFRTHYNAITETHNTTFPHSHTFLEVFYTIKDSVSHIINGNTFTLKPGNIWIVPPKTIHYFESLPYSDYLQRDLMFTHKLFLQACEFLGLVPRFFFTAEFQNSMPLTLDLDEIALIEKRVRVILLQENKERPELVAYINSFLCEILTLLMQKHADLVNPQPHDYNSAEVPSWLSDFLGLFKKADIIKYGMPALKKAMPLSYDHVARVHKQYTGKSIIEHLTEVRLEFAANLLKSTDRSIIDIAIDIGFNSLAHFNTIFQKKYKLTPSMYRRKK